MGNNQIDFSDALDALKDGYIVARQGWNGKDMHLALQTPDQHSKMTLPYIFMKTADNNLVPWLASQTDLLSEDWIVLNANPAQQCNCPNCQRPSDVSNGDTEQVEGASFVGGGTPLGQASPEVRVINLGGTNLPPELE